jgi:hypothetical protein
LAALRETYSSQRRFQAKPQSKTLSDITDQPNASFTAARSVSSCSFDWQWHGLEFKL